MSRHVWIIRTFATRHIDGDDLYVVAASAKEALASPQAQEAQENGWDLETPMPDYDLDDEIDEYEEGENG